MQVVETIIRSEPSVVALYTAKGAIPDSAAVTATGSQEYYSVPMCGKAHRALLVGVLVLYYQLYMMQLRLYSTYRNSYPRREPSPSI